MAIAQDLIKRALRLTGALGAGETLEASEATDGLTALNAMLDQWWIQRLAVYQISDDAYTWAASQTTQTIGSGGDFNTTRPADVTGASQRINTVDYPIGILTWEEYKEIPDKTTTTDLVSYIYPEYGPTLVTLHAWPVPSVAASITLWTRKRVESFTLAETVSLPPGYEDAIAFNLAVTLAPEYQRPVPSTVAIKAAATLRNLKVQNHRRVRMVNEPGYISGRGTRQGRYNWYIGY